MVESTVESSVAKKKERKRHSFFVDLLIRLVREKPMGTVGGVIVLILLLTAIFANWIAPYGFNFMELTARLDPSSSTYLFS